MRSLPVGTAGHGDMLVMGEKPLASLNSASASTTPADRLWSLAAHPTHIAREAYHQKPRAKRLGCLPCMQ
jgi:hypothetical protein